MLPASSPSTSKGSSTSPGSSNMRLQPGLRQTRGSSSSCTGSRKSGFPSRSLSSVPSTSSSIPSPSCAMRRHFFPVLLSLAQLTSFLSPRLSFSPHYVSHALSLFSVPHLSSSPPLSIPFQLMRYFASQEMSCVCRLLYSV